MLIDEIKKRPLKSADDVLDLKEYLDKRCREIEQGYDYRYGRLVLVFGLLLKRKALRLEDLEGLAEDKLEKIKAVAAF